MKGYYAGLLFGPLVVEFCRARDSQKPRAQWNDYRYWITGDSIPMPFLYSHQEPNAMLLKPEAHRYMPCRGVVLLTWPAGLTIGKLPRSIHQRPQ